MPIQKSGMSPKCLVPRQFWHFSILPSCRVFPINRRLGVSPRELREFTVLDFRLGVSDLGSAVLGVWLQGFGCRVQALECLRLLEEFGI